MTPSTLLGNPFSTSTFEGPKCRVGVIETLLRQGRRSNILPVNTVP